MINFSLSLTFEWFTRLLTARSEHSNTFCFFTVKTSHTFSKCKSKHDSISNQISFIYTAHNHNHITSVGFRTCQTSQYMFLFCLVTTDYTTRFLQSSLSLWAKYNKYKLCLIYRKYGIIKYDVRVFVSLQYHRKSLIFELKEAKHARVSAVNSNNCVWALKQTGGLFLCPLIPLQWSLIKNPSTCAVMEISIVTASHSFDPL